MQWYDFEIVHKKGSAHTNVDALSRPPVPMEIKEVMSMKMVEEDELSVKNLDPYDDEALLYFLNTFRTTINRMNMVLGFMLKPGVYYIYVYPVILLQNEQ